MTRWIKLSELASARSGDKGNHANVGIVAKSPKAYEYLHRQLTAERLHEYVRDLGVSRVERFELPKVWGMNFLLYDALAGGASQSLRIDTQGKLIGPAVMEMDLPVDDDEFSLLSGK